MGHEIQWLSFKSKEQKKKDLDDYTQWAFPYGMKQQEIVRSLLTQLFPKEDPSLAMMTYLLGRDAYHDHYKEKKESERNAIQDMYQELKKAAKGRHKKDIPSYMALIIADSKVDASLQYPSLSAIQEVARKLSE